MKKETIVISLGGSLVVPNDIDVIFLKKFRSLVLQEITKGKRFIIIVGGGDTARHYQKSSRKITKLNDEDVDWLGIHSSRLNAHLLRTIFRGYAYPRLITSKRKINTKIKEPVIIAAGFEPGASTDLRAVQLAKAYQTDLILNLSNIDWVYDKDPKKFKSAKRIKRIDWPSFRKIVGHKWDPGANTPFDPIASKWAERWKMRVIISRGTDIANLKLLIKGKKAKGTIIS